MKPESFLEYKPNLKPAKQASLVNYSNKAAISDSGISSIYRDLSSFLFATFGTYSSIDPNGSKGRNGQNE